MCKDTEVSLSATTAHAAHSGTRLPFTDGTRPVVLRVNAQHG